MAKKFASTIIRSSHSSGQGSGYWPFLSQTPRASRPLPLEDAAFFAETFPLLFSNPVGSPLLIGSGLAGLGITTRRRNRKRGKSTQECLTMTGAELSLISTMIFVLGVFLGLIAESLPPA